MTFLNPEQRQTLWWIAFGIALLYLFYSLTAVLTPFLFAAIIGYLLNPGVDWLSRHHVPRALACLSMILVFLALSAFLVLTIVPVMQHELGDLQQRIPSLLERLNGSVAPRLHDWFGLHIEFSGYSLRKLISDKWASEDLMSTLMSSLKVGSSALLSIVATAFLLPMVLFYLLVDWHRIAQRAEDLVPRRWHDTILGFAREIDELLSQFLRGQLSVMLILFVGGLALCDHVESAAPPRLAAVHLMGGDMEGKETRFGVGESVLTAVVTSNGATGSYNSMHDSYQPLGGLVLLVNMLLGEIVFGGLGTGL